MPTGDPRSSPRPLDVRLAGALRTLIERLADAAAARGDRVDRGGAALFCPDLSACPPRDDEAAPPGAPQPHPAAAARRLLDVARSLLEDPVAQATFARKAARQSLNPAIAGMYGGEPKGTLFVGDVLHLAGLDVPTCEVNGWEGAAGARYAEAERWPDDARHFVRISDLAQVRPGDLLVVDWKARSGACGGAHVEVVTDVAFGDDGGAGAPVVTTIGARTNGLAEDRKYGALLRSAERQGDRFVCDPPERDGASTADAEIHLLRPAAPRPPRLADGALPLPG